MHLPVRSMSVAARFNRVLRAVTRLSARRKRSRALRANWGGKVPRRATLAALKELKEGNGKRFSGANELYQDLGLSSADPRSGRLPGSWRDVERVQQRAGTGGSLDRKRQNGMPKTAG